MNLSLVSLSVVDYLTCWLFICEKNKLLGGLLFEHAQEHRACPYNTDINCQWNRALGAKGGGTKPLKIMLVWMLVSSIWNSGNKLICG